MEILLWQARTNKGWVLEQLEKKSGVSKATLNEKSNPPAMLGRME